MFLYIDPLKQGLKRWQPSSRYQVKYVFIHRSIKTRIETYISSIFVSHFILVFIHRSIKTRIETLYISSHRHFHLQFLYIDPLKQGLKRFPYIRVCHWRSVFIHRSIKTRIETGDFLKKLEPILTVFIHRSIKTRIETCSFFFSSSNKTYVFIHRSIKTRIETSREVYSVSTQ